MLLQTVGLLETLGKLAGQACHLLVERLVVLLGVGDANVAAGRQDEVLLGNLIDRRGLGEALFLFELAVAEDVECLRDLGYVLVCELA